MQDPDARQIIHFRFDGGRVFNHRAAGIAIRESHVLICREDDDPYTLLPGGRIEMGEDSRASITREIEEEMKAPGEVGRLVFTAENFFEREGRRYHELGMYYEVTPPAAVPFITGTPALVTEDEGHELSFFWAALEGEDLTRYNLLPRWLRTQLQALPQTPQHLVVDER